VSGAASSEGRVHGHRFAEDDHRRNGPEHSHGLVDASIKRSRDGLLVVGASLAVLTATAVAQAAIYVATGSVALLADLIHNAGDALTAVPLAVAFLLVLVIKPLDGALLRATAWLLALQALTGAAEPGWAKMSRKKGLPKRSAPATSVRAISQRTSWRSIRHQLR